MNVAQPAITEDNGEPTESDIVAMVEEIGTAVAAGLVPILGQAINVYDTIESLLTLHNSQGEAAGAEAKFDLVLALVGWIPGAGGGVKKTIRIVNKNPERYAPILFDVLRMVCVKLGIQTSPESLLDKLFDAAGLKAILGTAQTGVEKSWAYDQLPSDAQQVLSATMAMVRAGLPSMLLLVTMKLTHWKRMQRNTAARSTGTRKKDAAAVKPAAKDSATGTKGANSPENVSGNGTGSVASGTATLNTITNEVIGMLGEHITDYFLYEEYGWGKHWDSHDKGTIGSWETKPSRIFPGKLNERTKLNALIALQAHGVGIDGVWKVQLGDPHNGGKSYAIVESKASSSSVAPANASRKPGAGRRLSSNARRIKKASALATAVLPKIEDLLDPPTNGPAGGVRTTTSGGRPTSGRRGARNAEQGKRQPASNPFSGSSDPVAEGEIPIVQMSRVWIRKNIGMAVKDQAIAYDIRTNHMHVYSRHLFYTPFYLPASKMHLAALSARVGSAEAGHSSHEDHSIPSTHRYDEGEVKMAVNVKLTKLKLEREL